MQTFRILVEECDTDFRKYHTDWELCKNAKLEQERHGELWSKKTLGSNQHPCLGHLLITEIFKQPGVAKVVLSPYCLSVYIGKAFDRETIESQIKRLLMLDLLNSNLQQIMHRYGVKEKVAREFIDQADGGLSGHFPHMPGTLEGLLGHACLPVEIKKIEKST